ncbi:type II toxin-antitoxin system toxin DNA ADP-ribosyl transferase DarT [Frankia sp. CiP1_Cm_nod2]
MARPVPTRVAHFTHLDQLAAIAEQGLLPETVAIEADARRTEVGNLEIKAARRHRPVPVAPGGVVGDYAPFYFAPRSPMMYAIHRGRVATYAGGCDELAYLVTSVERLTGLGLALVFTDRNAVLEAATFRSDPADLDTLVDWPLMRARMWANTDAEPDRRERRMAECLVHGRVPWAAFSEVAVKNAVSRRRALATMGTAQPQPPVSVRPDWYF